MGGYQVVGKMLHDVNKIQDFTPYVARVKESGAQTVLTGNWSNDLLLLMKAAHESGLKARFGTTFLDQPGNLGNAGETALGYYVSHPFDIEAAGKEGEQFAADYKAKTGKSASLHRTANRVCHEHVGRGAEIGEAGQRQIGCKSARLLHGKDQDSHAHGRRVHARRRITRCKYPWWFRSFPKSAKYKVDGTAMGFKPVKKFTAEEASVPPQASCKMQRPN